ncbi:hypothetical protein V1478_001112 [Vespula squamosa]|uniref:Uncharacterized protein n=1 Tax=Vespula squamosa TaxID=30214 RepID=A0ABD2C7E9_VESSQ
MDLKKMKELCLIDEEEEQEEQKEEEEEEEEVRPVFLKAASMLCTSSETDSVSSLLPVLRFNDVMVGKCSRAKASGVYASGRSGSPVKAFAISRREHRSSAVVVEYQGYCSTGEEEKEKEKEKKKEKEDDEIAKGKKKEGHAQRRE